MAAWQDAGKIAVLEEGQADSTLRSICSVEMVDRFIGIGCTFRDGCVGHRGVRFGVRRRLIAVTVSGLTGPCDEFGMRVDESGASRRAGKQRARVGKAWQGVNVGIVHI